MEEGKAETKWPEELWLEFKSLSTSLVLWYICHCQSFNSEFSTLPNTCQVSTSFQILSLCPPSQFSGKLILQLKWSLSLMVSPFMYLVMILALYYFIVNISLLNLGKHQLKHWNDNSSLFGICRGEWERWPIKFQKGYGTSTTPTRRTKISPLLFHTQC